MIDAELTKTLEHVSEWMRDALDHRLEMVRDYDHSAAVEHERRGFNLRKQVDSVLARLSAAPGKV